MKDLWQGRNSMHFGAKTRTGDVHISDLCHPPEWNNLRRLQYLCTLRLGVLANWFVVDFFTQLGKVNWWENLRVQQFLWNVYVICIILKSVHVNERCDWLCVLKWQALLLIRNSVISDVFLWVSVRCLTLWVGESPLLPWQKTITKRLAESSSVFDISKEVKSDKISVKK